QRPVSQLSGRSWAAAVERATDRVIGHCRDLDPPSAEPRPLTFGGPECRLSRMAGVGIFGRGSQTRVVAPDQGIRCRDLFGAREVGDSSSWLSGGSGGRGRAVAESGCVGVDAVVAEFAGEGGYAVRHDGVL